MKYIPTILQKSGAVLSIGAQIDQESTSFSFIHLKKKKGTLIIKSANSGYTSISDLLADVPNKIPIVLNLSGKSALLKRLDGIVDEDVVVNSVIPGVRPEEFSAQLIYTSNYTFASIIRRNTLDDIIDLLKEEGRLVVDVSIGPLCLNNAIDVFDNKALLPYYVETNSSEGLEGISANANYESTQLNLNGQSLSSDQTLVFASGFSYFLQSSSLEPYDKSEVVKEDQTEFLFDRLQRASIILFVAFLILLVVGNKLMSNYYTGKISALSEDTIGIQVQSQLLSDKKQELKNKQVLLNSSGLTVSSNISYYCDRLASVLPNKVRLTKLEVYPLISPIKDDKKIGFQRNGILIQGVSPNGLLLNKWRNALVNFDWVSEVQIEDFKTAIKKKNAQFRLKVFLKNE